ncbi:hypothetical protein A2914_02540 [Candidatus Nomurabacteria bacterium RIFCSPLOWO2_01_FULL_41_21]|uniref:DUF5652 domain-containing protein n=2 Tax=Candidatus Nomuraibacteriota TaxID=1752729 RepID=A0A1F6V3L9_9BACT|nr:MAG: hypothetical protein A2733_02555 [Candidatus Nomurabacteria bacterium RIFCSPHIGHO2_01_FULL_40_20]OGI88843.1 MAG: hypothetical protein A2914_02540 [Candidatus Nomurabacteria bacterium RIFCSPLOWO2_01_FULL_41_21]
MNLFQIFEDKPGLFIILMAWSLVWKGIALWKSAKGSEKGWFIAILVINTFGLLEIFYLYALPHLMPHFQNLKNKLKKKEGENSNTEDK